MSEQQIKMMDNLSPNISSGLDDSDLNDLVDKFDQDYRESLDHDKDDSSDFQEQDMGGDEREGSDFKLEWDSGVEEEAPSPKKSRQQLSRADRIKQKLDAEKARAQKLDEENRQLRQHMDRLAKEADSDLSYVAKRELQSSVDRLTSDIERLEYAFRMAEENGDTEGKLKINRAINDAQYALNSTKQQLSSDWNIDKYSRSVPRSEQSYQDASTSPVQMWKANNPWADENSKAFNPAWRKVVDEEYDKLALHYRANGWDDEVDTKDFLKEMERHVSGRLSPGTNTAIRRKTASLSGARGASYREDAGATNRGRYVNVSDLYRQNPGLKDFIRLYPGMGKDGRMLSEKEKVAMYLRGEELRKRREDF